MEILVRKIDRYNQVDLIYDSLKVDLGVYDNKRILEAVLILANREVDRG